MTKSIRFTTVFLFLICSLLLSAQTAHAEYSRNNFSLSLTGQDPFAATTFGAFYDYYSYDDSVTSIAIHEIGLYGSYAILPNKLSISADLSMEMVGGDRSDFVFGHFGLGTRYTFFNSSVVVVSTGINLKLINQSLNSTFSPDIMYLRPYLVVGVSVWRLYFTPYIGMPIYIDINSDNDPSKSVPPSVPPDYPDRKPNYWQDENPFGIDYGVPIGLQIIGALFLTVEPSGMTWIYPDSETTLWVTPGIMYQASPMILGVGVKIRVYTSEPLVENQESWQLVFNAGISF